MSYKNSVGRHWRQWVYKALGGYEEASNGDVPTADGSGGINWTAPPGSGGGESNTASNLTGDEGIYSTKVGSELRFKSLSAGTGVTLNSDANTITVNSTGGAPVDSVNTQTGVVVLDPDDLDDALTTHKFTSASDISKLAGIATGADVTSANETSHTDVVQDGDFTSDGFLKRLGGSGSYTVDTATYITDYTVTQNDVTAHQAALSITESQVSDLGTYLTGNQTITLSGDATGSGTTAITVALANDSVDIATLSATGTASSSTFLRGDNTWAAPAGGGGIDANPGAFTLSTSHNITTTESTIPFDTEEFDPDTNYSNTSGEITVTDAGYYHVSINVPINDDGTGGATRGRVFGFLQRDQTTSTWVTVNNIRGQVYEREASGGTGFHAGGIVSLSASEVIRFRVDVSSTVDVSTESGEASLNIFKIRDA